MNKLEQTVSSPWPDRSRCHRWVIEWQDPVVRAEGVRDDLVETHRRAFGRERRQLVSRQDVTRDRDAEQLLLVLHREAVRVEKEEREEQAADFSVEDKLKWFRSQYHFVPKPDQFCCGPFAKALVQMGLGYTIDTKTDWHRARPSNGRRGEVLAGLKVDITTGLDVYNCLVRKLMTILLLFGDADIDAQKFTSSSRGVLVGTVRWLTFSDVYELKKACAGLQKLPSAKAEELVDWFEGKLSKSVKEPSLKTLSCALHDHLDFFEARIYSRTAAAVKHELPDRGSAPVLSKKQKK